MKIVRLTEQRGWFLRSPETFPGTRALGNASLRVDQILFSGDIILISELIDKDYCLALSRFGLGWVGKNSLHVHKPFPWEEMKSHPWEEVE